MLTKYTKIEGILEIKSSSTRFPYEWNAEENSNFKRFAALDNKIEEDGYLYVRCRAISSRVNKNNDGWPSEELSKGYKSFIGRPVFVDHHNDDPKRTRGVIVDSKLHVEDDEKTSALDPYYSTAPENHKPPTWIELLIEVDGKTYPKLAQAIRDEDIDAVSMGANIKQSVCSVCANEATTPDEFCDHIKKKGLTFEVTSADGEKIRKKAYEDCIGIDFFEISFVFDPADETALISEKTGKTGAGFKDFIMGPDDDVANRVEDMGRKHDGPECPECGSQNIQPAQGWDNNIYECQDCGKQDYYENFDPDNLLNLEDYLGKTLPMERVAALKKRAYPDASMFVEPVNTDHGNNKNPNYIPQSDKVTIPDEVNTLRNENLCPVCHASVMESGRDGILECPTCGHVQEPEPLNNPDLSIAQDNDLREDNAEQMNSEENAATEENTGITFTPSVARKQKDTRGIISEMFETILVTKSKEVADKVLPVEGSLQKHAPGKEHMKGVSPKRNRQYEHILESCRKEHPEWSEDRCKEYAARTVNKQRAEKGETKDSATIQLKEPITVATYQALDAEGLLDKITINYPTVEKKVRLSKVAPILNLFLLEKAASVLDVPMDKVPLVIEADTEENLKRAVEIIQEVSEKRANILKATAVTKPKSKETILSPNRDISDTPKDVKVVADQLQPVESAVTINISDSKDDASVEEAAPVEETVVEADTTEDDTSSVEDVVEAVEETEKESVKDDDSDTEDYDEKEDDEKEAKLLAAFRIADLSVELGLEEVQNKMAFIAKLEEESFEELKARETTLGAVKTAGLKKSVNKTTGIKRVPRLSHVNSSAIVPNLNFEVLDEQIFL